MIFSFSGRLLPRRAKLINKFSKETREKGGLMDSQKELIREGDWDCLIILDACRYDFFEEVYEEYLEGSLKKVKSEGVDTGEWLAKTFDKNYLDVTYISGVPHVNSLGINLKDTIWEFDWQATSHFGKIIDVWDFGWSQELATVPPKIVCEAALRTSGESRKIIHFEQPHIPFISLTEEMELTRNKGGGINLRKERDFTQKLRDFFGKWITEILGREAVWELKRILRLNSSIGGHEMAWREGKVEFYYEDNLRKALNEISDLVDKLEGKVVISSDHGECLGEEGYWAHGPYSGTQKMPRLPLLTDVPWLELEV